MDANFRQRLIIYRLFQFYETYFGKCLVTPPIEAVRARDRNKNKGRSTNSWMHQLRFYESVTNGWMDGWTDRPTDPFIGMRGHIFVFCNFLNSTIKNGNNMVGTKLVPRACLVSSRQSATRACLIGSIVLTWYSVISTGEGNKYPGVQRCVLTPQAYF